MKKKFTLFIMMLAALLSSSSAWAQTFIQGDMKYTVLDADAKTVSVAKANNDIAGDIVIPSTVTNGNVAYTVTTISEYAFENLPITSVSIPGTVTNLGERAFGDCHKLAKITFEESTQPLTLVYGYYGSFQYCDADKEVIVNRNLTPSEGCPFYDNVTSAVIGGKATTVANSLFYGQRKMTSISIGNSVTSIGNGAFAGCGDGNGEVEMTLTLSENITTIGEKAFFNCPALKSLALPSTLKLIGGEAFSYANIASLVIPESVDSIGEHAFENCKKLTSIRIEDSDKPLRMREGYNRPFHYCDAPKTVYLGRNLIQSEDGTPFETAVTSVEIGDKVTTINPSMFWGNSKLTSVTIGNGVKTIGSAAFRGAGNDEYTVGELSVTMGENVETICSEAFNSCPKLLSISLPSTLKLIEGYAFSGTGLGSITIPASVDSLGNRAFGSCGNLTSIRFEDSDKPLKLINGYEGSFNYSQADKSVYVGRDLTFQAKGSLISVGSANITSVEFGDKVTNINPQLFYDANKLNSLTIGKGVKTIGSEAFRGAGDDEDTVGELSVTMGENVETIGSYAFDVCTKLYSITLPSTLKLIEGYAFSGSGLGSISIPASVDSLGYRAFGSCGNLASISIEDSTEPLKLWRGYEGTFNYSNADKSMYIGRDLKLDADDRLFSNGTGSVTTLEFGDLVTTINPYLFKESDKLYSLTIGKGVKTIGAQAFYSSGDDADTVGELSVTMGENVETIGANAFDVCPKLYSINLPATLKTIEGYAFSSTGLGSITIPASVDSIGKRAFGSCGNLTSIRIEDSTEPLKLWRGYDGTFNYSNADKSMYIGRDLKLDADDRLFSNGTGSVTTLEFGDLVTNINPYLFKESDKLSSLVIGNGVKTIGAQAFYGSGDDADTVGELSVTMGENVETIGVSAFDYCVKMTNISLPATLKTIGEWAFSMCSSLGSIKIPGSVTSIGKGGFGNTPLSSITFEDGDEPCSIVLGYDATFRNPQADYSLYLGRNLVYEGNSCPFPNATAVTIGSKVTSLAPNMLNNQKLLSVKVPWPTPIAIQENVFSGSTYSNATLWLPGGTKQAYAEAEGWKNFVNVEFASYVVSLEATKGGSLTTGDITVSGEQKAQTLIDRGNDVTFSVKPEQNYDFTSLTVNGEAVEMEENAYTYYGLYQDIDVKAIFTEKPKFDIQATATGGTVSLNGANFSASQSIKVYRDTDVTLAIAANEGYEKPVVTVNGTDVTAQLQEGTLKIENIQEAKTIVVTFAKLQFAITTEQTQNGSIELSKQTVEWGDSFTATFRPATGYELATATVNGKDVTAAVKDGVLTVSDVKEATTVGATFKKLTFQIAAEQTQNGSIELSATTVEWGDSFTATFKPATGYELLTATVNGEDVTADVENNVLTVSDVRVNVTVGATFQKQTYAVTISGGGVTVSNLNPQYGEDVTVTIEDDPDRTLVSLIVNGEDVTAKVKNGQYIINNVSGNVTVEATFKSTKEFITMTGEYATFSCPQDLNFTGSDLRAYIASGFNKATGQALLTRVYDVPAGTGIFLVGQPGTTYKIAYSETSSYYVNLFKANLTKSTIQATEGDKVNFTYDVQDGEPGFYPIDGTATLLAQTAYMQLPAGFVQAGVKVSVIFEEDIIDGIEEFRISESDATIYDLAGRRLGKTQRGINIVNGKKVLMK
ncbi:MAG: leucine-rich repeat domain-containing protein [Bacteroidaceae bacterium]|nr:leucine-rich repeat domain-containing protein [Bacteroidaceae bacterium]